MIGAGLLFQPISIEKISQSSPDAIIILGGGSGLRLKHYAKSLHERYPFVPVITTVGIFLGGVLSRHV